GDTREARDYVARSLRLDPQRASARIALAQIDLEEGKYEEVLANLASLSSVSPVNLAVAQGLMGDALDALGRTSDAFVAYTRSNQTQQVAFKSQFESSGFEPALSRVQKRIAYFRDAPAGNWRAKAEASNRSGPVHVFLVGFPRSGTTLLEQVLAGHP